MKKQINRSLSLVLAVLILVSFLPGITLQTEAAGYVYNWGTREEVATELSNAALSFYTGENTYESFVNMDGTSNRSDVPETELYKALQEFMRENHTHKTTYNETRELYRYTDCENGGGKISSFYSGELIGPAWDGGETWNREHTWPQSKGCPKGSTSGDDIMKLRPTSVSENSSRSNKAYGESSGFYDPNEESNGKYNLHGDVARIMLYVYVRYGEADHLSHMWGSDGVIESVDVLFKWMAEDPVDTWELGRNDAAQSITGTRNVFVDYPELAYVLFDREIPTDMVTPSGKASNGTAVPNPPVEDMPVVVPTTPEDIVDALYELEDGQFLSGGPFTLTGVVTQINTAYSSQYENVTVTMVVAGKTDKPVMCYRVSGPEAENVAVGDTITVRGELKRYSTNYEFDQGCTVLNRVPAGIVEPDCTHGETTLQNEVEATCTADGYTGDLVCKTCGAVVEAGQTVNAGHKPEKVAEVAPTTEKEGTVAHYRCSVCGQNFADEACTQRLLSNHMRIPKLEEVNQASGGLFGWLFALLQQLWETILSWF